jgi:transcriptional regulator of acetoin/glycerol metabolism
LTIRIYFYGFTWQFWKPLFQKARKSDRLLVIISKNNVITVKDLLEHSDDMVLLPEKISIGYQQIDLHDSERDRIINAMQQNNSNVSRAAGLLGIDRGTLYRKLKKFGIEVRKSFL